MKGPDVEDRFLRHMNADTRQNWAQPQRGCRKALKGRRQMIEDKCKQTQENANKESETLTLNEIREKGKKDLETNDGT